MWLISRVQPLRIVPWLQVRDIEKAYHSSAISADVFVSAPFLFIIVTLALVVWLVVGILDERVEYAFAEDFFCVVGPISRFVRGIA